MSVREVPTRFAVAFSLAGEQRQLVLPIAQEVEAILGRSTVFYDDWYEHWIAGSDADLLLQELYGRGTELVIVCVSGAYASKPWTLTEHRAVRGRLMRAPMDRQRIFPIRVGDGEFDGVLPTEIVPDVRGRTPLEAAEMIVARLNLTRTYASGAEPVAARWPSDPPMLHWPMADHGEAREAFAKLLCGAAPERALLVRGASETGKSHMSKQMIRNAMPLPEVVSGRFDFKGTTSIGVEIEAFSQPLDIEPPTGRDIKGAAGQDLHAVAAESTPGAASVRYLRGSGGCKGLDRERSSSPPCFCSLAPRRYHRPICSDSRGIDMGISCRRTAYLATARSRGLACVRPGKSRRDDRY